MATPLKFRYFRSVPGFAVPRYGSATKTRACQLVGATRVQTTKEERQAGAESIVWNDAIVPLPIEWCRRYTRELAGHLRRKELVEVTEAEYLAAKKPPKKTAKTAEEKS
jgi:hypothetical protein